MGALMVDHRSSNGKLLRLMIYGPGSEILKSHIPDSKTPQKKKGIVQENYATSINFYSPRMTEKRRRAHNSFINGRFRLLMISGDASTEVLALPTCVGYLLM